MWYTWSLEYELVQQCHFVPTRVGSTCLLLRDELTASEHGNCTLITARAYAPFYRNPQPDFVSGANIIDMASVGIAAGLLENNRTGNASRITDAYQRVHNEVGVHSLVDCQMTEYMRHNRLLSTPKTS